MKSTEFIVLSACTMMLTALGIDIMLPVFADLRAHFGLPPRSTATAQVISFFFMGQIAQLAFGVLSDRFGRLAILRVGFPLYIVSGIGAAFAPSLELMYLARFLAGMGASAVFMTTIAGVRDRFSGDQMARMMSLVFTIFLSTPVFAPFLGLAILRISSWQGVFLTPPLFAMLVFLWSFRLKESLPTDKRQPLAFRALGKTLAGVLSNRIFLRYTAITTLLFTGLSTYVSASEHIVGEIYRRPDLFPWIFAAIGLAMSACALTNSRLAAKLGARMAIKWLLFIYVLIGTLLFIYTLARSGTPAMLPFFLAVAVLLAINLAIEPNSSALALEPMGHSAGIASAVYGTCFFFVGASLGSLITGFMTSSVQPLVIAFFIIGLGAFALVLGDGRSRASVTDRR
ncbi:MFS transporter [Pedobacter yulinensis]|uniref:MFS transporter n=1 Tax=Pedobacter yulinensis TaxID=2126353 RepID=A0A2T3HPE4_9SPHI|nr:MFS transporter [Pedobacter yulinensis]PST84314.1 MFS transporter [Pedobacter yulinensis]